MRKIIKILKDYILKFIKAIGKRFQLFSVDRIVYNYNYNPLYSQKRIAFVMLSALHDHPEEEHVSHPSRIQYYIILEILTRMNFVIDIYCCTPEYNPYNLVTLNEEGLQYDYILGFGNIYKWLCKRYPKARRILFITENAPWVVRKKYQERIDYYIERHGTLFYNISRQSYYDDEMFHLSEVGIAMSGLHNCNFMRERLKHIIPINVNALINKQFCLHNKNCYLTRKRFVWFGSPGLLHKGLDILIDVFEQLPDLHLDIYGAHPREIAELKLPNNVKNRGFVYTDSDRMYTEVVSEHTFVISLSCSEGMMSGIATCMAFGLIPITTLETGFDECPYCLQFDDWHIDHVKMKLLEYVSLPKEYIEKLSISVVKYAKENFTDDLFKQKFEKIMRQIVINENQILN